MFKEVKENVTCPKCNNIMKIFEDECDNYFYYKCLNLCCGYEILI